MSYIIGAFKIAILVIVGTVFLVNKTEVMNFWEQKMESKQMKKKVMKWVSVLIVMLGIAFEGGAFLAHLQGVVLQVMPLAVTGAVCFVAGIIVYFMSRKQNA